MNGKKFNHGKTDNFKNRLLICEVFSSLLVKKFVLVPGVQKDDLYGTFMYIIVVPRYTFPDKIGSFFTLAFMHSGRFCLILSKNYENFFNLKSLKLVSNLPLGPKPLIVKCGPEDSYSG